MTEYDLQANPTDLPANDLTPIDPKVKKVNLLITKIEKHKSNFDFEEEFEEL